MTSWNIYFLHDDSLIPFPLHRALFCLFLSEV